jgi:hypothetical protein
VAENADETCWGGATEAGAPGYCGKPMVCLICDTCAEHCHTEGGPDACWAAHERWRLGGPDGSLASITASMPPVGVRAAPKPRWS